MNKLTAFPALLFISVQLSSQAPSYWQQQVNYKIDVSLDDKEHSLTGFARIDYINNSPDTLRFIWFHLWPNAYKNDRTAYTDQAIENGSTGFYFSSRDQRGYINRLDFRVNNITAVTTDHPEHIDIVKLNLPAPLLPGQKILITTPFHVKLPFNFSRGGHDGQSYQATQWYPKPAVYDRTGSHPMPYLDQGEFYSEFGSYEVNITVPGNYVVAATGELQDESEKQWLNTRKDFTWEPLKQKEKMSSGETRTITQQFPLSSGQMKTVRYRQDRVHDFAWFADKRFVVREDTCLLGSGKIIRASAFFLPGQEKEWGQAVGFAKDAVRFYSEQLGEYPFQTVSVVQGPENFGGGMEYPTITVISVVDDTKTLDQVIAHEVGHNWFYGILASNERDHPWMDEGINSFYETRYMEGKYGAGNQLMRLAFETKAVSRTDQPISLPADQYSLANYGLIVYYKTAAWMRYLETVVGGPSLNRAMKDYFTAWKFKHPQPADFQESLEKSLGRDLDTVFAKLHTIGTLPNQERKGNQVAPLFGIKQINKYLRNPSRNLFVFGPAVGYNKYDAVMAGGFITNIKLPASRFQFLLAPLYGTKSRDLAGLGWMSYTLFPRQSFIRKAEFTVNGALFSMDEFEPIGFEKLTLRFEKIVPGIRITLREQDARSTRHRFIQFRSFLINEDVPRFVRDTTVIGLDTVFTNRYRSTGENRTLHQLKLVWENNRVLYPFRGELKLEQGKFFVRAALTGNYFFNYAGGGGLQARIFAGKMIYTSSRTFTKQFATDRYHLNMTGANGHEDYTYSDYFPGRNEFEGLLSQQIMVRDGAFKVRTDLLAQKIGRTDNWLAAINLSSTLPEGMNPLSLLPVKIPLKLFVDIGTYAETWEQDAETDRFLFDAGIQVPLFRETINFYFPVLYSKVYRDYNVSTLPKKGRFWKTVSFSIDISNLNLRRMDRNLVF